MDEKPVSRNSEKRSFIRFINKTNTDVDIMWLDYEGSPVKHHTISSDAYVDINTYVTHPWIFEDSKTRDSRAANNKLVFYPPDWHKFVQNSVHAAKYPELLKRTPRIVVMITLPVYNLRDRCLQVLRDSVDWKKNIGLLDELEFELPKSVLDDLYLMIIRKDYHF